MVDFLPCDPFSNSKSLTAQTLLGVRRKWPRAQVYSSGCIDRRSVTRYENKDCRAPELFSDIQPPF